MRKIYVLGNLLIKEDSLPIKLLPILQKIFPQIKFIVIDPNESFPPKREKDLIIFDTVLGIKEPMILDLEDFEKNKKTPISPHDYDLLFHLLLLKKMKKIQSVKIIGIPPKVDIHTFFVILNLIQNLMKRFRNEFGMTKRKNSISTSLSKNARRRTYKDQKRG